MVECEAPRVIPHGRPPPALAPAPEEPLVLAMFFGFRFRVWMLSFFIARGRGTWQGGRGGWLVTVCGHTCGLLHGHLPGSQPCRAGHCCGPVWGVANPQAQCFPSGRVRRSLSHPSLPGLGAGGSRRALGVSSLCPRLHGCREAAVKLWFPRARLHHQSSSSMCAWYGQWGHMCTGVYPLSPGPTRLTPYPVPQPRLGLGVHLCRQPHGPAHPVQLHVEPAGVAHRLAVCVAPPEGGGGGVAVGAAEASPAG